MQAGVNPEVSLNYAVHCSTPWPRNPDSIKPESNPFKCTGRETEPRDPDDEEREILCRTELPLCGDSEIRLK